MPNRNHKRPLPAPEDERPGGNGPPKRWRPSIMHVMDKQFMQRFLMMITSIIRTAVQEGVKRFYANYPHPAPRLLIREDQEARYQLQFENNLPEKLYTFSEIKSKNNTPIKISIIDASQREIIDSGLLSSVEIEVLVLDGDFPGNEQENWTLHEFNNHIVRPREGKGRLLKGKLVVKLNKGVGELADIAFTDNSISTRSHKFRLAVRLHQKERIKDKVLEGISEPFRVKDRRGKSNEKHDPPLLTDKVYYLEKIRKDGPIHKRLIHAEVHTVQEFLRVLFTNHEKLQSLLGDGKTNNKKRWAAIVSYATRCPLGNELCSYNVTGEGIVLIFNSVYQLLGAKFDGHYHAVGDLNVPQQASVEYWKKVAYQNPADMKFDHIMIENTPMLLSPTCGNTVPKLSPSGIQYPNHSDVATGEVDSSCQPKTFCDELSSSSPWLEYLSVEERDQPFQNCTFSEETRNFNSPLVEISKPLVHDFPMSTNSTTQTSLQDCQILGDQDETLDFQLLFQDIPTEDCMPAIQKSGCFQATTFDTIDVAESISPDIFATLDAVYLPNEESGAFLWEYPQANLPSTSVPTSPCKWGKLIAILKFRISISKCLRSRRAGIVHPSIPTVLTRLEQDC